MLSVSHGVFNSIGDYAFVYTQYISKGLEKLHVYLWITIDNVVCLNLAQNCCVLVCCSQQQEPL